MILRPKKFLGQHFLNDENIARKIIGALNPELPLVIEIGPGKGVLSKYLLEDPRFDPWFVEIDREAVAYLKQLYPAISERIIEADFLTVDLSRVQETFTHYLTTSPPHHLSGYKAQGTEHRAQSTEHRAQSTGHRAQSTGHRAQSTGHRAQSTGHRAQKTGNLQPTTYNLQPETRNPKPESTLQILGNFPYNISSQILFRVLEYRDLVAEVTGMFQKEVAQRIASPPGSKAYGILSVLLQAFYRIEYLFTVNESVFSPPPKVKSAVIRLVRNEISRLDCDEKFWVTVVKTAFNQRRKTLRNSLKKLGPHGFSGWDDPVFDLRPERLDVAGFVRLARMLHA